MKLANIFMVLVLLALLCPTFVVDAQSNDLVLYYSFDSDNGREITDDSTNDNFGYYSTDAYISEPSYYPGIYGSAIYLTDTGYISTTGDMENVRTISMWFKPYEYIYKEPISLFYRDGNSSEPGEDEFGLHFTEDDSELVFSNGQANIVGRSNFDDWEKEWYHVAVTIDATEGTKMYFNGNLTSTNPETVPINVDMKTSIGRHGIMDIRYFHGYIDEFKLYNEPLTQEEIQEEYHNIYDNYESESTNNIMINLLLPYDFQEVYIGDDYYIHVIGNIVYEDYQYLGINDKEVTISFTGYDDVTWITSSGGYFNTEFMIPSEPGTYIIEVECDGQSESVSIEVSEKPFEIDWFWHPMYFFIGLTGIMWMYFAREFYLWRKSKKK